MMMVILLDIVTFCSTPTFLCISKGIATVPENSWNQRPDYTKVAFSRFYCQQQQSQVTMNFLQMLIKMFEPFQTVVLTSFSSKHSLKQRTVAIRPTFQTVVKDFSSCNIFQFWCILYFMEFSDRQQNNFDFNGWIVLYFRH